VTDFLVELYVSREAAASVGCLAGRARAEAERLSRTGTPVRVLRSIFVPADETCFLLFEAGSIEDVRAAASSAGLPFERISEAVAEPSA